VHKLTCDLHSVTEDVANVSKREVIDFSEVILHKVFHARSQ
jgi:hypothetical protein